VLKPTWKYLNILSPGLITLSGVMITLKEFRIVLIIIVLFFYMPLYFIGNKRKINALLYLTIKSFVASTNDCLLRK
jgi:hypothetical protein